MQICFCILGWSQIAVGLAGQHGSKVRYAESRRSRRRSVYLIRDDTLHNCRHRVRLRFRAAELSDSTISISSLGERGVEALFGVIYPPQVAIVGFGAPTVRPWIGEGSVQPCLTVALTLAADHRVSDGHREALFLNAINKYLLEPGTL